MTAQPVAGSRHDINCRDDVHALVEEFYGRAFRDALLGPVFVDIARMDLPAHLPIMCDFWETVLFRAGVYKRNAFTVHRDLNAKVTLTEAHFGRWLEIWSATVDSMFEGPRAEFAKLQATRIAGSIHRRLHRVLDIEPLSIGRRPE